MADEAKTILTIDPGPALAALDQVRASLDGMQAEYKELNRAGGGLFDRAGASTSELIGDVDELAATMGKAQAAMRNLIQYEKFLEAQQRKTVDPALIKRYADEIARTRRAMAELRATGVDAWDKVGREQQKTAGLFGGFKGLVARALPVLSLSAVAVGAIRAAAAYEQTKVSFETFLKSGEKAEALLSRLNTFAAKTPFSSDQINAAAKSLLAFGESEQTVIEKLEQIGTISAATGKDFNELTTIYGKARTAGVLMAEDINQLVEAGIPVIDEFAKILETTPDKVKKLASEGRVSFSVLETTFKNLTSEGGRFAGLLEKQSRTAVGVGSTLSDIFGQKLRKTFGFLTEALKELGGIFIDLFDTTKTGSQVIEDERIAFLALSNQVKLTNVGTKERSDLIGTLQTQYPEFLKNVDKEKVTNEQLKPILDQINKSYIIRIALQKQQEKLQPILERQADAESRAAEFRVKHNKALAEAAEISGVDIDQFKTQEEQVKAVTAALQKQARFGVSALSDRLDRENRLLTPLNRQAELLWEIQATTGQTGVTTNALAEAEREATEALKQRDDVVEEFKRTYGELFDVATKIPPPGSGSPVAPTKPDDAQIKAAAEAEKKRQELRLSILRDGREKEITLEESRFEALTIELNKYFKGRKELQSVIAQAEEQHGIRIGEIHTRFDAEEITRLSKLESDRQSIRLSLIEEGTQKEIDIERRRFEAVQSEIKKQFEGSAELPGLLESAETQHIKRLNQINVEGLTAILESEKQIQEQEIDLFVAQNEKVILLMRQRGASEEDIAEAQQQFDLLAQQKRLESEIQFQQALLLATDDGDDKRRAAIQAQIDLLNQQLENVQIEIDAPKIKGAKFDLAALLGLDEEGVSAIKQAAGQIVDSIGQITAARLAAAEAELQIAQDRVGEAEDALEQEIELAEQGFASNVDLKRAELEEAKKLEAAALEERKKAQRQQAAVDTLQQAVSLITASTNIFKSLSALGPFGIGLAIAIIATMFAAFAKVKLDAQRAAKLKHGGQGRVLDSGVVVGPSHDAGGVPIEVEGGEFFGTDGKRFAVVKKHLTTKHFHLLEAINRDNTPQIASLAAQLAAQEGIVFKSDTGANIEQARSQSATARKSEELAELKKSNALLAQNNAYLKKMLEEKGTSAYFDGGREERTPGLTKIIRNR